MEYIFNIQFFNEEDASNEDAPSSDEVKEELDQEQEAPKVEETPEQEDVESVVEQDTPEVEEAEEVKEEVVEEKPEEETTPSEPEAKEEPFAEEPAKEVEAEEVVEEEKVEEESSSIEESSEPTSPEGEEVKEESATEEAKPAQQEGKPHTSSAVADEFLPKNFDPFARPTNPKFANRPQRVSEFEERVLEIKRVIKTTKGGRRFKFSALVVVGDKNGRVGYAVGKHIEVPEAIKKAIKQAKKNIYRVNIVGENATVPHEVIGKHGSAKVMLKPAAEGKGVIASDSVRAVVELAGIRNIYSKNLGTNNKMNVVHATISGLTSMKTKEEISRLRDKEL